MRITETALREIVRQEARRLNEMGPGGQAPQSYAPGTAPHFSYRTKLAKLQQAMDILLALNKDEYRMTGESDPDLENLIEAMDGYMGAVEVMAEQER
jgi:hypothetical protein